MKLIGYARVSTKDQHLEGQIEAIEEYCKTHNHDLVMIFSEKMSGVKDKERIELHKALDMLKAGRADGLVTTKVDRASRSLSQLLNLVKELDEDGHCLICFQQNIDSSDKSPIGKAFMNLLGTFAELERDFIRDRIREGRARAKEQGKSLGGQKPIELDKDVIIGLRNQGFSIEAIRRKLSSQKVYVSANTIRRRLTEWRLEDENNENDK